MILNCFFRFLPMKCMGLSSMAHIKKTLVFVLERSLAELAADHRHIVGESREADGPVVQLRRLARVHERGEIDDHALRRVLGRPVQDRHAEDAAASRGFP